MAQATQDEPQPSQAAPFFINMHDSKDLDESSRTQVRVQVMKDYHRRRSQRQDKPKGSKPPSQPSAKAQTLKFRLGEEEPLEPWVPVKLRGKSKGPKGLRRRKTPQQKALDAEQKVLDIAPVPLVEISQINNPSPLPNYELASDMIDPFNSTALPITPRTQLLLHHYFNIRLPSSWLMMPMRKTLYSVAITDPAMFHSFISHYAASYNTRFKIKNSVESVLHTTNASILINKRLSDPENALTDSTIATVANLCAYEASNGSKESMVVHMNGLERMVRLRGGLQEGGFSLIVQRMIAWSDFHVASALLEAPRFPPLQIGCEAEPFQLHPDSMDGSSTFGGKAMREKPTLEDLLNGVQSLSLTLRLLRQKAVMPREDIWYSDKIYFLQRHLFDLAYDQVLEEGIDVRDRELDRLCALAALMYCGHCLRDIPLSFGVFVNGVTRLKIAIESFERDFMLGGYDMFEQMRRRKMFWVLGFGGCAAEGKAEREWYVHELRMLSLDMQIMDWDSAKEVLECVLWQPELDEVGTRLWREVYADFVESFNDG